MEKKTINGVDCYSPSSRDELISYAFEKKSILIAVNAEKILHATVSSREIINRNIGYPDGIGAVWGLKKKGVKNVEKIPGCELWLNIIEKYYNTNTTFYLIGGKNEVINETIKKLKNDFSGIKIVNYRNGYISNNTEKEELISDIQSKKPDVIFVAMGSPKQELLMEELHSVLPALYQGLGGSFDVYTGYIKRAPIWWIKNNLEWAFRLLNQPSRIKRQILLFKFLWNLKMNKY
jgi:UDP-N-acetyl-D-mannosaminouronate:lipid I N-acetyl-D-mannosaminouronosyltransferase